MQFASDLASGLRSEAPFHTKQIRRACDPGLLRSQSMVLNSVSGNDNVPFAYNLKRKSTRYSMLSLQGASLQVQLGGVSRVNIVKK